MRADRRRPVLETSAQSEISWREVRGLAPEWALGSVECARTLIPLSGRGQRTSEPAGKFVGFHQRHAEYRHIVSGPANLGAHRVSSRLPLRVGDGRWLGGGKGAEEPV